MDAPEPSRRRRTDWRRKFAVALSGVKIAVRAESSFCVHLFFAVAAVLALVALDCTATEWALVLLCVGGVITCELMNTAIETLFRGFDAPTRDRVYPALDIAAGAVLTASLTAAAVGCVVFGRHLWALR